MKTLKWFFSRSWGLALLNKMLFVDQKLVRCFILESYSYKLTILMESIFSFLPSYFPIIFLAKRKISKLIILCFSVIQGQNSVGQSNCRISNKIYLQKKVISLLFYMLITKIKSWQKNIGVVVVKSGCGHPGHKMNG